MLCLTVIDDTHLNTINPFRGGGGGGAVWDFKEKMFMMDLTSHQYNPSHTSRHIITSIKTNTIPIITITSITLCFGQDSIVFFQQGSNECSRTVQNVQFIVLFLYVLCERSDFIIV